MNPKASNVKLSLKASDWKNIVGYFKLFNAMPSNAQWVSWADGVVETIKSSATNIASEQSEFPVILKPSVWRLVQTALKPVKKDETKEHREMVIQRIQSALNFARQGILVTTGDIKENYEIVGPVYFQISNKGLFSNQVSQLSNEYRAEIVEMRSSGQIGKFKADWSFIYGDWSAGQSMFEQAFYVSVQEIRKRTMFLDADAVIAMRQDIDLDTTGFQYFYLQMYGTAIRLSD